MIEIGYDKVVHTSDHFDKIQQYTEQLIKQGDAFMDDTDGETVRLQRLFYRICHGRGREADMSKVKEQRRAEIPSKNRDATIEQNLARFRELLTGSEEGRKWSLRAKIDYQHKNGTMRDPVVYRFVDGSHHITGCVGFRQIPPPYCRSGAEHVHESRGGKLTMQHQVQGVPDVRSRLPHH